MDWRLTDLSKKPRVVLLVSKFDHCLAYLLHRWKVGDLNIDIPCVISNHEKLRELVEWYGIPSDKPITGKPLEVRQGKGKGNVEYWVAQIQPGRIMFEIEGVDEELAREAFSLAASKLPFDTTFVKRTVM